MDAGRQLNLWVVKSNRLVEAKYDWTLNMHRVVLSLVSSISMEDERFMEQEISAAQLAQIAGINSGSIYSEIERCVEALADAKIRISNQGEVKYGVYNLMSHAEYLDGRGVIRARFNEQMRPLLLELKERFTRYMLEQVMQLRSPYSVRMYELCKQYESLGHRRVSVDRLRGMLCLEDKYARFVDLRRNVIDRARDELEEKCDVYFSYDVEREGRSPVALLIRIYTRGSGKRKRSRKQLREPAPRRHEPRDPWMETHRAFERWFAALGDEEKEDVRAEAMRRTDARYPEAGPQLRTGHIEAMKQEIWQERVQQELPLS